ncbi:MAG: T9SS C-terminal target domain-containing protein [Bacteroidetes bacterium]|nr:T9SS C-terminal target domain-containing protein [Bacteroidota bacterium]
MRNICKITFLLLFVFNSAFSQEIEWQNTIGGIYGDKLKCTMRNNDGGVILAGYSNSPVSGDKTEVNIGGDDFWIVKIDSMGNIQWQRTLGGSGRDRLTSIQKVANGGLVLGGYSDSDSSGNKSEASNGSYDYWIVKIDSNGIIQWQNTIGGSSYDALYSLQSTNDGGYILGGYSNSPASGDKSEGTSGFVDIWIVKVDSVGVVEWEKTIGGNGSDGLFCLNQTKDNGFILASASSSGISGEKNDSCRGLDDYWIIKFNSDGIIEWQKTIGGSDSDYPYAIQQTQDDGYIVGGKSLSPLSGEKQKTIKDFDMWVVKIDSIGNTQWQNTIGGNNYDILNSIVQTPNNEFLIGGMSGSGIGGDKTENVMGQFDYWVLKLDSLGNILWQNTIGGSDSDELNSVELTSKEGSYYLGGVSYSNSSFDKTENGVGGQNGDFWVIKLTESYNLIKGNLFADFNSNGIQDNGEPPLPARKITELNSGRFAFSEQNGNYSVLVVDSGSFTVSPQSINWYTPSPISHAVAFTGIQLTDSLNDFAFQPQGTFEDVYNDHAYGKFSKWFYCLLSN